MRAESQSCGFSRTRCNSQPGRVTLSNAPCFEEVEWEEGVCSRDRQEEQPEGVCMPVQTERGYVSPFARRWLQHRLESFSFRGGYATSVRGGQAEGLVLLPPPSLN
jgi:hypothetical protein